MDSPEDVCGNCHGPRQSNQCSVQGKLETPGVYDVLLSSCKKERDFGCLKLTVNMRFRPCIDLHDGVVKQIVGSTLTDDSEGQGLVTNFTATQAPAEFAKCVCSMCCAACEGGRALCTRASCIRQDVCGAGLARWPRDHAGRRQQSSGPGSPRGIPWWPSSRRWNYGRECRRVHRGGCQPRHCDVVCVQVRSGAKRGRNEELPSRPPAPPLPCRDGKLDTERLQKLMDSVGKEHLVLDLSCRKRVVEGAGPESPAADAAAAAAPAAAAGDSASPAHEFVVVTDRWQKWTDFVVNAGSLSTLAAYCDEFLVHGVDVEGRQCGVEEELVAVLGAHSPIPVTYAGGVRNMADIELVQRVGKGRVDVTVGSALDIFGGALPFEEVVKWHRSRAAGSA